MGNSFFVIKVILISLVLLLGKIASSFGTTLAKGDLAIIGITTDNDEVKIATLVDLDLGTTFSLTDNAWDGTKFCTSEFAVQFTVSCTRIAAGSVFYIDTAPMDNKSVGTTGTLKGSGLSCGSVLTYIITSMGSHGAGFDSDGDNIFLFTGTFGTPASLTFIHALLTNSASTSTTCAADDVDATRLTGTGLATGTSAILYGKNDKRHVKCGSITGTDKATVFSQINIPANWTNSSTWDATPATCAFSIGVDCSKITGTCVSCDATMGQVTASGTGTLTNGTIKWLNPNTVNVMVVAYDNNQTPNGLPTSGNGTSYTASGTYTSGSLIGTGHVIYKGTNASAGAISSLKPGAKVNYAVYEVVSFCGSNTTCYIAASSNCIVPLPVELLRFYVSKDNTNQVKFEWVTATERNNNYFEIEASSDGTTFNSIGKVNGNGTSQMIHNYTYTSPYDATLQYFRLKQMDFNGHYNYSDIVFVRGTKSDNFSIISVFPQPTSNELNILFNSIVPVNSSILIYDLRGSEVYQSTVRNVSNYITLDMEQVPAGVYFMNVITVDGILVKKIYIE